MLNIKIHFVSFKFSVLLLHNFLKSEKDYVLRSTEETGF